MNLNGVNQFNRILPKVAKQTETVKPQKEAEVTEQSDKKGDSGCLKSYFAGAKNVSFGHYCSTASFQVKKLKDVPCCCCGKPMLRESDLEICQNALANTSGRELAANIKEYSKYMRADEKALASILAAEAIKSGKDISHSLGSAGKNLTKYITDYNNGILTQINKLSEKSFKDKENPVTKLISETQKSMAVNGDLDRTDFVEKLDEAVKSLPEKERNLIQDTAMNLPQSFHHVEKIHEKYSDKNNMKLARRLFSTALTTAEHIHPHSLGGPDDTKNYIAECAGCNNPRGNMSYAEWLKIHPEYPRKAQEHIEHVEACIINGELPETYQCYPVEVRQSLSQESGGRMVLKVLTPATIKKIREQKNLGEKTTVEDVKQEYEKQEKEKAKKIAERDEYYSKINNNEEKQEDK